MKGGLEARESWRIQSKGVKSRGRWGFYRKGALGPGKAWVDDIGGKVELKHEWFWLKGTLLARLCQRQNPKFILFPTQGCWEGTFALEPDRVHLRFAPYDGWGEHGNCTMVLQGLGSFEKGSKHKEINLDSRKTWYYTKLDLTSIKIENMTLYPIGRCWAPQETKVVAPAYHVIYTQQQRGPDKELDSGQDQTETKTIGWKTWVLQVI